MRRGSPRGGRAFAPRRTNWLMGNTGWVYDTDDVAAGETRLYKLWDVGDASREEAAYVDATLVRTHGIVMIDRTLSAAFPGSDFYAAAVQIFFVKGFTPTTLASWNNDDILAWDLCGDQHTTIQATAVGIASYAEKFSKCHFDIKAQRRMADNGAVWLGIQNSASSNDSFTVSFLFRGLFKE